MSKLNRLIELEFFISLEHSFFEGVEGLLGANGIDKS